MTVDELRKTADRLPHSELAIQIQLLIMSACENAADTLSEGTEEDEEAIANSSLQVLLGDERRSEVCDWFRAHGFSW